MAMTTFSSYTATNVFNVGNYTTELINVDPQIYTPQPPPKPLLIATPSETGVFPILLFLHGYLLHNYFYSQLIQHIASHGFIVVAPQLYSIAGTDATEEVKSSAEITNWLSDRLQTVLPPHVQPNLGKIGLSGHSRGGKVAFALALGKIATTNVNFSAIIGVDPVDGYGKGKQSPPPVLTYIPHSFNLDMAAMVIGSGLGEVPRNLFFPACAPKGVNHLDFYNECRGPAWYFVAKDYGHVDMLDDNTTGLEGRATYFMCKNGKSREPMRTFVGGAVVAFLRGYFEGDLSSLMAIKDGLASLPVELQTADFLEECHVGELQKII